MESLPLTLPPRTPGVFVGLREETFPLYTTSVHTLRDGGRSFKKYFLFVVLISFFVLLLLFNPRGTVHFHGLLNSLSLGTPRIDL